MYNKLKFKKMSTKIRLINFKHRKYLKIQKCICSFCVVLIRFNNINTDIYKKIYLEKLFYATLDF